MLSVTSASSNKKPADKPVMETSADGMDAIDQKAGQQERVRFQNDFYSPVWPDSI
jgi:hypothetical protein